MCKATRGLCWFPPSCCPDTLILEIWRHSKPGHESAFLGRKYDDADRSLIQEALVNLLLTPFVRDIDIHHTQLCVAADLRHSSSSEDSISHRIGPANILPTDVKDRVDTCGRSIIEGAFLFIRDRRGKLYHGRFASGVQVEVRLTHSAANALENAVLGDVNRRLSNALPAQCNYDGTSVTRTAYYPRDAASILCARVQVCGRCGGVTTFWLGARRDPVICSRSPCSRYFPAEVRPAISRRKQRRSSCEVGMSSRSVVLRVDAEHSPTGGALCSAYAHEVRAESVQPESHLSWYHRVGLATRACSLLEREIAAGVLSGFPYVQHMAVLSEFMVRRFARQRPPRCERGPAECPL